MQTPTLGPKLTDRGYWIDSRRSFARASFFGKWGQRGSRESCILLENEPTRSLIAMALQHWSLAIREFRTASKERCGRGKWPMCANLAAGCSGTWSSSKQSMWAQTVNFRVTTQKFCMVGGYTEDLTNHRTVKIGEWALAWGWTLAQDNTVLTYIILAHTDFRCYERKVKCIQYI